MSSLDSKVFNQLHTLSMHYIIAKSIGLAAEIKLDELLNKQPIEIDTLVKKLNLLCPFV